MNRTAILLCLLFMMPVLGLWAGGAGETDPMDQARSLVVEKKYDQAILILSEVIALDDERLDEAEALMRQIRAIRGNYNQLFQELYDVILNEPGNNDRILRIINQMLALDQYPNQRTRDQIEKARLTAKLQVDRSIRSRIMEDARALLAQQRFFDALSLYTSGFYLQREEFESGIQSREFKDRVYGLVTGITGERDLLPSQDQALELAVRNFEQALAAWNRQSPSAAVLEGSMLAIRSPFALVTERQTRFRGLSGNITEARQQGETEYPAYIFNEYIRFIQEFMNGPPARAGTEGIVFAAEELARSYVTRWMSATNNRVEELEKEFQASLDAQNYQVSLELIPLLSQFYQLHRRGLAVASAQDPSAPPSAEAYALQVSEYRDLSLWYWTRSESLAVLGGYLQQWQNRPPAAPAGASLAQQVEAYLRSTQFLDATDGAWNRWSEVAATSQGISLANQAKLTAETDLLESWRTRIQDAVFDVAIVSLSEAGERQYSLAESAGTAARDINAQALALLEGVESGVALVRRYPDRALNLLPGMEARIQEARRELNALESRHAEARASLRQESRIRDLDTRAARLKAQLDQLSLSVVSIRTRATANIARAQEFQRNAEAAAQAVRDAIRLENLVQAEARLQAMSAAYFESLELLDSAPIRAQSQTNLADLQEALRQLTATLAIRRINTLKTQAQDFLDREDFETALARVEDAQAVREQVFPGNRDVDLDRLLQRIIASGSLTRDRFFSENDPAYNTLANFMNLARLDIDAARNTSGANARARLDRATQSLDNVLLIKPNNWDAKILKLEITRLRDPQDFSRIFGIRFREIIDASTPGNEAQTLTELQVLETFNPNYPGLRERIRQLRVTLGLEENPVTVANRNESTRLTREASTLANSRDFNELQRALGLLERAISLNSANQDARLLADRIRIRVGAPSTVVLSPEDEQLLRRAQRLRAAGSTNEAYTLIMQIYDRSANNKRHPTVLSEKSILERTLGS